MKSLHIRTDRQRNRRQVIRKAHLSFQLRWAKIHDATFPIFVSQGLLLRIVTQASPQHIVQSKARLAYIDHLLPDFYIGLKQCKCSLIGRVILIESNRTTTKRASFWTGYVMAFLSSDWEKKSCFNINAHLPSLWILPVHTFVASLWILPVHTFAISVNLTCPHICHLCGSYLSTHLPSLWILPVHTFAIFVEFTCPLIRYLCGSYLSTHLLSLWILPAHFSPSKVCTNF